MQAWLAVNLTADLRDSFTWNTRQIYLWLTADYETQDHKLNQAVFWNWIIENQVSYKHRSTNVKRRQSGSSSQAVTELWDRP